MRNQNLIEIAKFLTSIATPIVIAFIGYIINGSIQRQNAIAQRQSSWLVRWADDFFVAASNFNASATKFLMLFYKEHHNLPGKELARLDLDIPTIWMDLQRWNWEMKKYADFARITGKGFEQSAEALCDEVSRWTQKKGGNVDEFREKQLMFNTNARNVHAELMELQGAKEKRPLF